MNLSDNQTEVNRLIKLIDSLRYKFYDENNEEEALNELECAVVALESYIEIIERDMAFYDVMSLPNED
jgi:hypothetical protein